MTLVSLPGATKMYYPFDARFYRAPQFGGTAMSDSGHKLAVGGRIWFPPAAGWKNISRVGFLFGSTSGLSDVRVSLQSMVTTSAPPRPLEVEDQYVDITNADVIARANSWYRTGGLSPSARQVKFADKVCVVFDWAPSTGFVSGSYVEIRGRAVNNDNLPTPWTSSKDGTNWYTGGHYPNVVLEFSDGSFGTLDGSIIMSDFGTISFNSGSSPNEYGLRFTPYCDRLIDGAIALGDLSGDGASDFELKLYDNSGANLIWSTSWDANTFSEAIDAKEFGLTSVQTLVRNTAYYLTIKPTTTNNVNFHYITVADSGHNRLWGDSSCAMVYRTGAGAWTVDSTGKIPLFGVSYCGAHDSA